MPSIVSSRSGRFEKRTCCSCFFTLIRPGVQWSLLWTAGARVECRPQFFLTRGFFTSLSPYGHFFSFVFGVESECLCPLSPIASISLTSFAVLFSESFFTFPPGFFRPLLVCCSATGTPIAAPVNSASRLLLEARHLPRSFGAVVGISRATFFSVPPPATGFPRFIQRHPGVLSRRFAFVPPEITVPHDPNMVFR